MSDSSAIEGFVKIIIYPIGIIYGIMEKIIGSTPSVGVMTTLVTFGLTYLYDSYRKSKLPSKQQTPFNTKQYLGLSAIVAMIAMYISYNA